MIHLLETELPETKSVYTALLNIYGINKFRSSIICKKLGLSFSYKVSELSNEQRISIVRIIERLNFSINSDLKRIKFLNKKKLVSIKSYRGLRRIKGFPVRGQRTRSNSKTSKKIK